MKIWANTIVHNEENFIWFALMSIVDYVDKILVWDTGSTDNTVKIINEIRKIKGDKIEFKEAGTADKHEFTKCRQEMLEQSKCDWIIILDGDEVWWEKSIENLVTKIQKEGDRIEGIVVPMILPVGDIYHFQEEKAGKYRLLGRKGHISLRGVNKKIPGLHVDRPYGMESYLDDNNRLIYERGKDKIVFLNTPYLHLTHLKRSNSKRIYNKFKYELGNPVSSGFKFPEVFYHTFPSVVASPWVKISGVKNFLARALTPLRKIKRRVKGVFDE